MSITDPLHEELSQEFMRWMEENYDPSWNERQYALAAFKVGYNYAVLKVTKALAAKENG